MNVTVEAIIGGTKEWEYTIKDFYGLGNDYVSRQGNSWEICYQTFQMAKEMLETGKENELDYDYLALQLAFYLASWGMYRGSSFLKALDYRIHLPAVKWMLEPRYRDLFTLNPLADSKRYHELLFGKNVLFGEKGIYCRLNDYYGAARASWKEWKKKHNVHDEDENEGENTNENESIVTDTLLTKILLGVYGCIPAYDINFKKGISIFGGLQSLTVAGDAIWKLNKDGSLAKKTLFYVLQNEKLKDDLQAYAKNHNIPFMKAVDMYFFGLGFWYITEDAKRKAKSEPEIEREEVKGKLKEICYLTKKL